jgi:hypothetical protein
MISKDSRHVIIMIILFREQKIHKYKRLDIRYTRATSFYEKIILMNIYYMLLLPMTQSVYQNRDKKEEYKT